MTTIYFDMDGTITNLYGVKNWLPMLLAEDPTPYLAAEPLVNMDELNERLEALKAQGYRIGIVSWLSKGGTSAYGEAVRAAKRAWLKRHFDIKFDELHFVRYGTPKSRVVRDKNGILFDDELPNRLAWKGTAYNVDNILEVLDTLTVA